MSVGNIVAAHITPAQCYAQVQILLVEVLRELCLLMKHNCQEARHAHTLCPLGMSSNGWSKHVHVFIDVVSEISISGRVKIQQTHTARSAASRYLMHCLKAARG